MNGSALVIAQSRQGSVCIVALTGRIDSSNAPSLLGTLGDIIDAGERAIVVDFASIAYLTSAAFRTLLVASDQAEKSGARLALCGVVGQVRELFEMGGLMKAFDIHGSREDACAKLG
ncbi:MAG: STAS domain-containing protein [Hyphomicrobiales bacterium]|nr:STAS domain-containing protein [Hyphomicrobiales bacterium]